MEPENFLDVCGAHLNEVLYELTLKGYKVFIVERYEGQSDRSSRCMFCLADTKWIVLAEK
jgi:hypothetical protein